MSTPWPLDPLANASGHAYLFPHLCWDAACGAVLAGPGAENRAGQLGRIVAHGVGRIDHVGSDHRGPVRLVPVRDHDVAVPVGGCTGSRRVFVITASNRLLPTWRLTAARKSSA